MKLFASQDQTIRTTNGSHMCIIFYKLDTKLGSTWRMYHKYIMLRMEVPTCIRSEVEWVQMKSQAWKFSMCTLYTQDTAMWCGYGRLCKEIIWKFIRIWPKFICATYGDTDIWKSWAPRWVFNLNVTLNIELVPTRLFIRLYFIIFFFCSHSINFIVTTKGNSDNVIIDRA